MQFPDWLDDLFRQYLRADVYELIDGNENMLILGVLGLILLCTVPWFFTQSSDPPPALNPDQWIPLPLVEKENISHNTRRFRFALPDRRQPLGLPIGQHIAIRAIDKEGNPVMDEIGPLIKPYTPTSTHTTRGHVDFVIKIYEQGRMSRYLDRLAINDIVHFKGPKGSFNYVPNAYRKMGMIAGGTGITPCFQVLQAVLMNPNDKTELSLIFANVTEADILLKGELDAFATLHKNQFKVHYVLDKAPATWTGSVGYVTQDMIQKHLPAPSDDVMMLRCGPPPMMKVLESHLKEMGYATASQFQF